jgi:hypothetical protein
MDERSISQFIYLKSIDFSRPALKTTLVLALVGLALSLVFFKPYTFGSAAERRLIPTDAAAIGLDHFSKFGVEPGEQLVTALPVQDEQLIFFARERLGPGPGNEKLKTEIPGMFWEVALRSRDDHTTALEWRSEDSFQSNSSNEIYHAFLRIDEQGRWFQFYHRPQQTENAKRLSTAAAVDLAFAWAGAHPLIVPGKEEPFSPSLAGKPQVVEDENTGTRRFQWELDSPIEGLTRQAVLLMVGDSVSYYGLEHKISPGYPDQLGWLWRIMLQLRILLLVGGILLIIVLLIKQLRRDAIDFHFSFTYSALLTFPIIAIVIANLPSLMNEGFVTLMKESFYLLSSSTFLWLVLLLLATPVVALTDSLVRQLWPEKLSTFDALIRGRFHLSTIGRAILIGLGTGLGALGLISLTNFLLMRFGSYSHTIFVTSLSGPVAIIWAVIGSLGSGLVFSYALLFIATLARLRFQQRYTIAITGLVWLVLLSSSGGRYSSLLNFGLFALINTGLSLYLLFRYDLLTLIVAQFAGLCSLAGAQMMWSSRPIYFANGVATFFLLAGVAYCGKRLAGSIDRLPGREFVPEYIARLHSRERIERDIEIARQLQYKFLPQQLPHIELLQLATYFRPAYEVGGDYYDFMELGQNRLGLVIADVSGKGIPAAFYMTMIKGIVQSHGFEEVAPRDLLKQINRVIYTYTETNTFVTFFYAIIDTEQATLVYSNAGHNPPLLISRSGQIRELNCGGVVLGVMPQPEYQEEVLKLSDGDLLLLYTDGVVETTDVQGMEFGPQRLASALKNRDGSAASDLITEIGKQLDAYAAGAPQIDDITMILVSFNRDEKVDNSN